MPDIALEMLSSKQELDSTISTFERALLHFFQTTILSILLIDDASLSVLLCFCAYCCVVLPFHLQFEYYIFCIQAEKKDRIWKIKLEQGAAKVAEELQECKFFLKPRWPLFQMIDIINIIILIFLCR